MSREDLHRYNVQVAIVGISLWVLANIVGNYVLPRFNSKEADRSTGPAPRMAQRLENTDQQPSLICWSDQRVNGA